MKNLLLLLFAFISIEATAQKTKLDTTNTTSELPEGTYFKGNKILIKKGYKATVLNGKKIIVIQSLRQKLNNSNVKGAFNCYCKDEGGGECQVLTGSDMVQCIPFSCTNCRISTVIAGGSFGSLSLSDLENTDSKQIPWRTVVFPGKKN